MQNGLILRPWKVLFVVGYYIGYSSPEAVSSSNHGCQVPYRHSVAMFEWTDRKFAAVRCARKYFGGMSKYNIYTRMR